jgi:hypothetical protein
VQVFAAAAERLVTALVGPVPKPSADTVKAFTRSLNAGVSLTLSANDPGSSERDVD